MCDQSRGDDGRGERNVETSLHSVITAAQLLSAGLGSLQVSTLNMKDGVFVNKKEVFILELDHCNDV